MPDVLVFDYRATGSVRTAPGKRLAIVARKLAG
jgi:hypothetical protein